MDPVVQARKAKLRELEQSLFGYSDNTVRQFLFTVRTRKQLNFCRLPFSAQKRMLRIIN